MAELRYVDWDGLVYYDGKIKEYIRDKAEDYLKMGGVLPIKNLPDPSWQNLNYIYKITDEFTSNDRFEKPGYVYPAGTWVQCVNSKEDERWLYIIFNEETIGETADLSDYYTKSEVEDKIQDAIDSLSSEIDLGNYYTKDEVDTLIPDDFATQSDISILDEAVANIQATIDEQEETLKTKADKSELNSLATKKELEDAINNIEHPTVDLTGYATEEYVDNAIENIPSVDLSEYAKTAEVDVKLDAKVDRSELSEFATKTFVESEIAKAQLGGGDVTEEELTALLSDYYRKDETYSKSEIDAKIPSIEGLATKDDVAAVESKIPDVSNFATKSELDEAINNIEHPSIDLSGYATKEELTVVQEQSARNEVKLLQVDSELFDIEKELEEIPTKYTTKTELEDAINSIEHPTVDLEGYATEQWVNEQGFAKTTDIPDVSNFATKAELDDAINSIEHPTVDLTGYATEDWVKVVANTNKYEVLPLEGMFVQYNDNEVRINTEHVDMSTVPPQNAGDGSSDSFYYVTFRAYAPEGATSVLEGSSDKMDTEHSTLATDKYGRQYTTIWAAIASKSGTTWSKFGDKSTLDKYLGFYYNFWWYNDDKLISKEKVRVILTNDACHNDLVPDAVARRIDTEVETAVKDLATQQYVDTKISEIEIPDVSNFVTNDVVNNLLATKADDIPFTTNKVVTNAVGQFALNDSVKDLTVAQILTKILGLVDYIEPTEPTSLVDKILLEKLPMYSINNDGELAEVPFRIVSASDAPAQSGFYYVEQDGKTIEGGYQDITIRNDELYYIIALPKEIDYNTMIELQSWDPVDSKWIPSEMNLISNPATVASLCAEVGVDISHIDTEKYTVWALEDVCTGSSLRYIIKEEA